MSQAEVEMAQQSSHFCQTLDSDFYPTPLPQQHKSISGPPLLDGQIQGKNKLKYSAHISGFSSSFDLSLLISHLFVSCLVISKRLKQNMYPTCISSLQ